MLLFRLEPQQHLLIAGRGDGRLGRGDAEHRAVAGDQAGRFDPCPGEPGQRFLGAAPVIGADLQPQRQLPLARSVRTRTNAASGSLPVRTSSPARG